MKSLLCSAEPLGTSRSGKPLRVAYWALSSSRCNASCRWPQGTTKVLQDTSQSTSKPVSSCVCRDFHCIMLLLCQSHRHVHRIPLGSGFCQDLPLVASRGKRVFPNSKKSSFASNGTWWRSEWPAARFRHGCCFTSQVFTGLSGSSLVSSKVTEVKVFRTGLPRRCLFGMWITFSWRHLRPCRLIRNFYLFLKEFRLGALPIVNSYQKELFMTHLQYRARQNSNYRTSDRLYHPVNDFVHLNPRAPYLILSSGRPVHLIFRVSVTL